MNDNEKIEANERVEEENKSDKNWDIIKENSQYVPVFSGIIYVLAMIINNIYSFYYSIEAEKFYRIPRKYFYENLLGDINVSLIYFILLILILISPSIIKKMLKKIDYHI